ncbi:ABC transporter permease [Corallococcus sp. H22C18031201]|uniref:ABC transporter permease n=1 Tax=Citreicoccus inhibens TaxID=2849499 RepID=UPI000E7566C0|nr:ABC-2 family transporter protein [Citreicoccus inhibens]MBU8896205.1 ABC-2 family transporter protein [Citreicoccus inhibens]RJS26055.1 ABC transporter permease [Corallococcus sp. H22C18031201]
MSLRNTVRAFPTLLKVGFSESVAYRAELLVWVLSTTMPLIMMALWTAVARTAPVGRFGQADFVGYFLATFAVRQLISSWAAWLINWEVKQGTLSMRLLRPISPLWAYAAENIAAFPMRLVVAVPVTVLGVVLVGWQVVPRSVVGWGLFAVSILGGWLITFLANAIIGSLSLFMDSSQKLMEVYLVLFFVCSGYMYPVELFPPGLRTLIDWLPFRYQIGLPTELMTNAHGTAEALRLLAFQWGWVAVLAVGTMGVWRYGLRRFAAFGG